MVVTVVVVVDRKERRGIRPRTVISCRRRRRKSSGGGLVVWRKKGVFSDNDERFLLVSSSRVRVLGILVCTYCMRCECVCVCHTHGQDMCEVMMSIIWKPGERRYIFYFMVCERSIREMRSTKAKRERVGCWVHDKGDTSQLGSGACRRSRRGRRACLGTGGCGLSTVIVNL